MKGNDNLKKHLKRTEGISSRRIFITALTAAAVLILGAVLVLGVCLKEQALTTDFTRKNIAPCIQYPFGTDWMGRDMFVRTLTGLSLSIRIGLITSVFSSVIAVGLGLACAAGGKWADSLISGLIDVVMGIPHILLLLLISFALGKGLKGVAVGIILTHWTSLTRLIRGEVLQLRESHFIKIAEKMGMSPWQIGIRHMMPHLLPQVLVGMVLMFPHAILHEASISGVSKINVDTDLRLAMTAGIRKVFVEDPSAFDPRKYLIPARELVKETVSHKMKDVFGSANKA